MRGTVEDNVEVAMLNEINNCIRDTLNPSKVILFGSRARGEESPDSDFDILVLVKNLKNKKQLYAELRYKLYSRGIVCPMDIIIQDLDKYTELITEPWYIYKNINEEGKVIYDRT